MNTAIRSDIKILDSLVALNLNISPKEDVP